MREWYGIAGHSIIPVRKEPAEQSEMISQILFGEIYKVLEEKNAWLYVQLSYDDYKGYIPELMHTGLEPEFWASCIEEKPHITASISIISPIGANFPQLIPAGSSLNIYSETSKSFRLNDTSFRFYSSEQDIEKKFAAFDISDVALRFLNAPYLWGGRTIFGIDCSGFTQIVYKICGIKLLRDAYQQFSQGKFVTEFTEIRAGDLAFFGTSISKISHVGILLNNEQIIHASGKVRIDKWDEIGIFNAEKQKYSHKLIGIKRIENVV
jgi:hypothetical protein